jgi:ATP-dependent helicase/nuclease subunit A
MTACAYQLDGRAAAYEAFYAAACDPRRHVVVEACAGAGKTWMLVARIVRALLDGARPEEILAITFTRKAAGEMRARLAEWLRAFARCSPAEAATRLRSFGLTADEAAARAAEAIGLHERVLAQGRAVEVRTFHAWYAQLLAAAPWDLLDELGLAPAMTPLEDIDEVKPALMRAFHAAVLADDALAGDFRELSERHGRFQLGQWLDTALEHRVEIELADEHAGALEAGLPAPEDAEPLAALREASFVAAMHEFIALIDARRSRSTPVETALTHLNAGLAATDGRQALTAFRHALFTDKGNGTPRKQLGQTPQQAALCDELDRIAAAQAALEAHRDHAAMARLSRALFAAYAALKRRRGLVDMSDLERVALALLSEHELAAWVQQRLDARVRHLLIDEFQDTSPLQWHALHAWLSAYAGAGGGGEGPRLFIVGDPKQSIYRFRRAEPRVFEAAQRFVVEGLQGTLAACDHTRRCALGVVAVVNHVFGALAAEGALAAWREHTTERGAAVGAAPALTALPSAERPARAQGSARDGASASAHDDPATAAAAELAWRPSLTVPRHDPKTVLREAEAGAVARAIERLIATEGVAPGDIMVLARRRNVLELAADALAALHLPHVAPETARLGDLPEARDLLAVLDVLASPGQAMSLARALKSPLFGATDDDLLWLAQRARSRGAAGWWTALMAIDPAQDAAHDGGPERSRVGAQDGALDVARDDALDSAHDNVPNNANPRAASPALRRAATLLRSWQAAAEQLPPHDLLDRIVHDGELLPRLAAAAPPRLRARALHAVRALLAAALELDGGRNASAYRFVRELRRLPLKAAAAQTPAAVRLLTIHGAKGLEAKFVFLMDTEPEPPKNETTTLFVDWPVEATRPSRVAFVAAEARCPAAWAAWLMQEQGERAREEVNALYVALTRAEDRVLISRTLPHRGGGAAGSWWSRLSSLAEAWVEAPAALTSVSERDERGAQADEGDAERGHTADEAEYPLLPLPTRTARGSPATDAEAHRDVAAVSSPDTAATRLGKAVHRLLEWLTRDPSLDRRESARAAAAAFDIGPEADTVARIAQRILDHPSTRRFFDPAHIEWAGNEVPIVTADGQPRRIDRMVRLRGPDSGWWVLDYKLSGDPMGDAGNVAQLAAYREAVARVVNDEAVRAAFIAGSGALVEA